MSKDEKRSKIRINLKKNRNFLLLHPYDILGFTVMITLIIGSWALYYYLGNIETLTGALQSQVFSFLIILTFVIVIIYILSVVVTAIFRRR